MPFEEIITNLPTNQPTNLPTNHPINRPADKPTNQPTNQPALLYIEREGASKTYLSLGHIDLRFRFPPTTPIYRRSIATFPPFTLPALRPSFPAGERWTLKRRRRKNPAERRRNFAPPLFRSSTGTPARTPTTSTRKWSRKP